MNKSFEYKGKIYKNVAVFGVGGYFQKKKKYIEKYIPISLYADNAEKKWGMEPYEDGITCIAPAKMLEYGVEFVIIGVKKGIFQEQLIQQIEAMEIPWCVLDEIVDIYIDIYDSDRKRREAKTVNEFFAGKEGNHRLILVNTPQISSTVGDHAISTAEMIFLKSNFPDRILIEIGDMFFWEYKDEIKRYIHPTDTILIQGGGYLGSLWRHRREDAVRYILQTYAENKIVILPMTMYFEDTEDGRCQFQISKAIYNCHENLTICFREGYSYELSKTILEPHINRYLIPDTVTYMKYPEKSKNDKSGVAVFFKNDKETILSTQEQERLSDWLCEKGYDVRKTSMFYSEQICSAKDREQMIRNKMDEISRYEMMITDAMHGMVLAAVSGTTCIGVESITGKVGGVYEWLRPLSYVKYAKTYDEIIGCVQEMQEKIENKYDNSHLQGYFDKLKEIIE